LKTAPKTKKDMPKISDAPAEGVHSDFGHVPEYLQVRYSDEKVANRDTKIWHLVIENGY
jgi:hypothetical protein